MEELRSRKYFLLSCVSMLSSLLGLGLISGSCNTGGSADGKNGVVDSCSDLSGIGQNDLEARQKLNYVDVSADKSKTCSQCNLYIPPNAASPCGRCMIFKGPVEAGGACAYWVEHTGRSGQAS